MRRFIERALAKLPRLTGDQMRSLLYALAEENSSMAAALDSMFDGIIVCDLEHVPIIYNKTAARMLRLPASEAVEGPIWRNVADEDMAAFLRATLEGEERVMDREFALESIGMTRLLSVSAGALVAQGKITGTIIHIEDITDKRQREARLRRAENLASLTNLAAGVAHEIKNPLGAISIHIQLLRKALLRDGALDRKSAERHLNVVDEEIDRLNRTVVDFLFAVRPMDMRLRTLDLSALLAQTADFMRPEALRSGVELHVEIDDKLPPVLGDERYLKQALLNLLTNALAAMPEGGDLHLRLFRQDDQIKIEVADTGRGIAPEILSKIFEPYFTTKENGTGLGLTITYKIAREHGGDISVVSKPEEGSVFTLSLPVPQQERRLIGSSENQALKEAQAGS